MVLVALGAAVLLARGIIRLTIPLSVFAGVALVDRVRPARVGLHLLSGGLWLGAFFMATDYVTSPNTRGGQIVFGLVIGVLTGVIRIYGGYPEGICYAILLANAMVPALNLWFRPRRVRAGGGAVMSATPRTDRPRRDGAHHRLDDRDVRAGRGGPGRRVRRHRALPAARPDSRRERARVSEMLALDPSATVREVRQYLAPAAARWSTARGRRRTAAGARSVGVRARRRAAAPARRCRRCGRGDGRRALEPLGPHVRRQRRRPRRRGSWSRARRAATRTVIRFFVGARLGFDDRRRARGRARGGSRARRRGRDARGSRASTSGRRRRRVAALDVTRDPMPEDWRAALAALERIAARATWRARRTRALIDARDATSRSTR